MLQVCKVISKYGVGWVIFSGSKIDWTEPVQSGTTIIDPIRSNIEAGRDWDTKYIAVRVSSGLDWGKRFQDLMGSGYNKCCPTGFI